MANRWQRFWISHRHEKWKTLRFIVRGVLRHRHNDSPHLILMGRGVKIDKRNGRLTAGGVCTLRHGCRIAIVGRDGQPPARLHIGKGTDIGDRTIINVKREIRIGARCAIAWDCDICDSDFHQVIMEDGRRPDITSPVVIEDDVWIGSHCLILKGITIGHGSVIAAGSVVRHNVPPCSLMVGNPARNIGRVTGWIL